MPETEEKQQELYYVTGSFGRGEDEEDMVEDSIPDYQQARRIMKKASREYPFVKLYNEETNKLLTGEINQELLRAGKEKK